MKIKKIRKLSVNGYDFKVKWGTRCDGAAFSYISKTIEFVGCIREDDLLPAITHELWEMCAVAMGTRLQRPDCCTDYIFVYDHRQHDTMCDMFAGLIKQFIA